MWEQQEEREGYGGEYSQKGVRGAGADSAYQSRAQAEQRVPLCQQSSHNADLCKEHRSCP